MGRYLLYVSYLGHGFSGIQHQNITKPGQAKIKTVASVLQEALKILKPSNDIKVIPSSRTDAGVHALCNTVHVDLQHRKEGREYDAKLISRLVNTHLFKIGEPLKVLRTRRVVDNFNSRFRAVNRKYLYRLAVTNPGYEYGHDLPFSLFESNIAYLVPPLDIPPMQETVEMLNGTHNFINFTTQRAWAADKSWRNPVKTIEASLTPGQGLLEDFNYVAPNCVQHWNLNFKSNSFLFRQVRRMVAALVSVGKGDLTPQNIHDLLHSTGNDLTQLLKQEHLFSAPAHGLFLTDVEYNEQDLTFHDEETVECTQEKIDIDIRSKNRITNRILNVETDCISSPHQKSVLDERFKKEQLLQDNIGSQNNCEHEQSNSLANLDKLKNSGKS